MHHGALSPKYVPLALLLTVSGLVVEPFAWLQSLIYGRRIQACACPDVPVVVIGYWRSGTAYLHLRPIDSIRSLAQVKQRLAQLVGLQEPPSSRRQVEEKAAARDQLQEAYARSSI